MRAVYALVIALGGAAVADEKAPDPLKAFETECVLVAFDGKGVKLSKDDIKKMPDARREATVTGNQITAEFGGTRATKTFTVDATKTPPHIDLTSVTKDGKTETSFGIYKVEKGVLTICATDKEAKDRPTEFKAGRDAFVMTLRKRGELEGGYLLTGLQAKGLSLSENDLRKVPDAERRLVIDDDQIVAMFNGKEDPATFAVDNTKTPRHITLVSTRDGKSETNYGIYKFENGTLTICATEKGAANARPTEFKATENAIVMTLQKQPRK